MHKYKLNILFLFILLYKVIYLIFNKSGKKVGVIGLSHSQNVGNNLLKYAIFIKLSELGYSPEIVGKRFENHNISFISNIVKLRLINNFTEIKENDYDILMVNSDQTWRKWDEDFYDVAFLKFAENWEKPKFVYGTSIGDNNWMFSLKDEEIAKHLVTNFTGISVREKNLIHLIDEHLGFESQLVLDPTLLIDKSHYLRLIKDFKSSLFNKVLKFEYIFVYILIKKSSIIRYLRRVKKRLKLPIYIITYFNKDQVQEFLYGIINSKAVITDSFHGTVFSIIFKKPFVSFFGKTDSRFNNLFSILNIKNRKYKKNHFPPISLLTKKVIINESKLKSLKSESIKYLLKNLNHRVK